MNELPLGDEDRPRLTGTVWRIAVDRETKRRKGYGFIRATDGLDYFFHQTDLIDCELIELAEGDAVHFSAVTNPVKGPRAIDVTTKE